MGKGDLNITVDPKGGVITVLEGTAPKQPDIEPKQINISGNLEAPKEFWKYRGGQYDPLNCHVEFSRSKNEIKLFLDDRSKYFGQVTGKLDINPDIEALRINSYSDEPMHFAKTLKKFRAFAHNRQEYEKVLSELVKMNAKIETEIKSEKDNRGNSVKSIVKTVESNIPMSLVFEMPIFKGYAKKVFSVEIALSATDVKVTCSLESPELEVLILQERDTLIDQELLPFKGIMPVIEY